MSNMKYCQFENTYRDLQDCYEAMVEGTEDLSKTEKKYFERVLKLCKDIVTDFCEPDKDGDY